MTEYLAAQPDQSHDRYILLDSVDWMDAQMLRDLWAQIRRTARPGSRMICRTAGFKSPFETLIPADERVGWDYREAESLKFLEQDRSAIYGGFHLYVRG